MLRIAVYAGLLGACAAVPARAMDAAMFNRVALELKVEAPDKYDERALLAGLLARPNEASAFEAEGRAALDDPALHGLFVDKWRGRVAAFAETERNRPPLDLTRAYRDWKEVMGPEGCAYIRQRLKSMSRENRDKLLSYLSLLDEKLKSGNFRIEDSMFSIAKRIVGGIREEYARDIAAYQAAPSTRRAAAAAPGAALALAEGLRQREAAGRAPAAASGADDAFRQAQAAERAGAAAGAVFDGGRPGPGAVAAGTAQPPAGLSPPTERPSVVGSVPPPGDDEDDIDARVAKARQHGPKPITEYLPRIGGGLGAALGGLFGFLLGGPIGAAIGAALLGGAGYALAKKFT